jgi:hypothetical protein
MINRLDKPIGVRMTNNDSSILHELASDKNIRISTYCREVLKKHLNEKTKTK